MHDPSLPVQARVDALLGAAGLTWRTLVHRPAASAVEAAAVRGTSAAMGGKALVMRGDRGLGLVLVAVPGDRRLDNQAFRRAFGLRRYRFATAEELAEVIGLQPGTIPPFGRPVFDLPLVVDASLAATPEIAFTPGRADLSYVLDTPAWLRVAEPLRVLPLTHPPQGED
ncbi:MAG: hypothetical protein H6732_14945 [Alphaproteobacteria bacterium]|nr:hypothetical protein [Alphaproteobacteria bacterium]